MNARRATAVLLAAAALAAAPWGAGRAQDAQRRRGFSIRITEPKDQDFVLGRTRIAAEVTIDRMENLDRVEFLVGDKVIFVDREPPFECFYDFGEESKVWIIRAVAYHREGISVSDAVVTRKLRVAYLEEVNRVILWATVTDRKDHLIADLKREDLRVYEEGKEQKIIDFYPEDRPITLAILLDSSGSMREQLKDVHEAAEAFVDTLRPKDRALVIDFDEKVFLIQDLTSDHDALKEAITSTEAIGGTAIFDVLHAAYRKLRGIRGRKAIIILSDGDDTASRFGFDRILEEAKANNVIVYGIGLGGDFLAGPSKRVLKAFSDVTGGRAFFVKKAADLAGVYQRIAEELRRQYYLTYSSPNKVFNGRWIPIRVETTLPGAKVRHRRGYFAVRVRPAAPAPKK